MAVVLAYYGVDLRSSQITVGLGFYVLGLRLSSLLSRVTVGVRLTPPRISTLPPLAVPGLADIPIVRAAGENPRAVDTLGSTSSGGRETPSGEAS